MGRRNETNRKAHKKEVDDKKRKEITSKEALKLKRKEIPNQHNAKQNEK